jgi:hypothetical protein
MREMPAYGVPRRRRQGRDAPLLEVFNPAFDIRLPRRRHRLVHQRQHRRTLAGVMSGLSEVLKLQYNGRAVEELASYDPAT